MSSDIKLEDIRQEISEIDKEMRELFNRRMEQVRKVAEYKIERGLAVEDAGQEQRIIDTQAVQIKDEELRSYYTQFITNTMTISKRWQHRLMDGLNIACCGDESSEDYAAAKKIYPEGMLISYQSYKEAYEAARKGECDVAVLPIEKSYVGDVGQVLDLMYEGNLHMNAVHWIEQGSGTTRYAVLSSVENEIIDKKAAKAFLLMFTVKDEAGGLAKAINAISAYDFNMRIMRSRPMPDLPWHYYFYAEAEGDDTSDNGRRMLTALRVACPIVKVVGRYSI